MKDYNVVRNSNHVNETVDKKPPSHANSESNSLQNPTTKLKFIPDKNIFVVGPPHSGKTTFIKKFIISGIDNFSSLPYDGYYYVGNTNEFEEIAESFCVANLIYNKSQEFNKFVDAAFYLKSDFNTCLMDLKGSAESRKKPALVVIDDLVKDNSTDANKKLVSYAGESQHIRCSFIIVSHEAVNSHSQLKALRAMLHYYVFINEYADNVKTVLRPVCDQAQLNSYIDWYRSQEGQNPDGSKRERTLIFDKMNSMAYDYNLNRILV